MTEANTDTDICDDPETCRRGQIWLGWYAGGLVAAIIVAAIFSGAVIQGQRQASDFAYARDDAALQVAETFSGAMPRGY